jgi:hypothetical protein
MWNNDPVAKLREPTLQPQLATMTMYALQPNEGHYQLIHWCSRASVFSWLALNAKTQVVLLLETPWVQNKQASSSCLVCIHLGFNS